MGQKETFENQLVSIHQQAEQIKAKAEAESRDLTEDEAAEVEYLVNAFKGVEEQLDALPKPRQASAQPIRPQNGISRPEGGIRPRIGGKMADMFGRGSLDGFSSDEEFFTCIYNRLNHHALRNASNVEGVGTDGGFVVPSQLVTRLLDESLESEIVRPRATVFPMASNELNIAGIDSNDHSANIGGLSGVWMGESETATPQKAAFRKIMMKAHKLAIFTRASNELVEDGIQFAQQLTSAMRQAISFDLDEVFLRGNGVAKPLGILNSASLISVAKEGGQTADTLTFTNLVAMYSRMHPAFINNAVWIAHPSVVPQLYKMSFEGATSSVPAYMPANSGLTSGAPATLFGRPLLFSEKMSVLGDKFDICFVDLSKYAIGIRREATLQMAIEPGWLTDESDWRLILRVDGTPLLNTAITPRQGATTFSWAVTLDERA